MKNLYDDLSETYIHPSYNPWYGSDGVKDVGLIKLKDRIRFERDEVEPACLNLLSLRDFSGEHFQVTAWDSKMETSSYSNMLHMEEFQAVSDHRRKTRGNYISATSLHSLGENGFFGEPGNTRHANRLAWTNFLPIPGAPLMRNQSGKFIVEGLASHIDDRFTHDSSTGLSLMFTQFIRLESSRAFIQHFVGREYCRGSTVYSCIKKDGIFPDPENRSKFYICDNNVPISQTCPSGTEFDPSHVCCITIGDSDESDRDWLRLTELIWITEMNLKIIFKRPT